MGVGKKARCTLCAYYDPNFILKTFRQRKKDRSIPSTITIARSWNYKYFYPLLWASLVAQLVKNLPAMQETWVQYLGWEDPLEKATAYPLQYSGLENSMNRGTWQATVHGGHKELDTTE